MTGLRHTRVSAESRPAASPTTRTLALAGIVGPLWFTTLVIVQGVLQPDYSHVAMPVSALAAWPIGWMQNLNFYVAGALIAVFAAAVDRAVAPTALGWTGVGLLVTGGAGVVLSGLFPWTMVDGVATEPWTHVVGAVTAFAATGLGLIVFSRRLNADARWHSLAAYTLYSGIVVLVLFLTVGFFAVDAGTPLHPWAGLIQRILCTVWFAWMIVVAIHVRRTAT